MKTIAHMLRAHWEEGIIGIVILLTRLPFLAKTFSSWDAVQYALALNRFDLEHHQPHPPGYILYVGLGKVFKRFLENDHAALIAISVLVSVISAILVYRLLVLVTSRGRYAFLGTLVVMLNPYIWYYGEVVSVYVFDMLFGLAFALLAFRLFRDEKLRDLVWFSVLFAVAGGFRESVLPLFAPLWLFMLLWYARRKGHLGQILAIHIGIVLAIVLAWGVPLILLSGGWSTYWHATQWLYDSASLGTSVLSGATTGELYTQAVSVAKVSVTILGVLVVSPLLLLGVRRWGMNVSAKRFLTVMLLWLVPTYAAVTLIHFGNTGYLMPVAVGILLVFLVPLHWGAAVGKQRIAVFLLLMVTVVECALFLSVPVETSLRTERAMNRISPWTAKYTLAAIRDYDEKVASVVADISRYDPSRTMILNGTVHADNLFRTIEYALPDYLIVQPQGATGSWYLYSQHWSNMTIRVVRTIRIDPNVETVLVISDDIEREPIDQSRVSSPGSVVTAISLEGDTPLQFGDFRIEKL